MKKAEFYIRRWKGEKFEKVKGYTHEVNGLVFGLHKNEYGKWNSTHLDSGIAYTLGRETRRDAVSFVADHHAEIMELLADNKRIGKCVRELSEYKEAENGR